MFIHLVSVIVLSLVSTGQKEESDGSGCNMGDNGIHINTMYKHHDDGKNAYDKPGNYGKRSVFYEAANQ